MRRMLTMLKEAQLERYAVAKTPLDRLMAVIDANFSDRLFTLEQCAIWMQFWANAPYVESLSRLHRINRARVTSHFRAELRSLLPDAHREIVREALQSYMDGVWLEAAQANEPLNPAAARAEARRFTRLMLENAA